MRAEEFDELYASSAAQLVGQLYAVTGDLAEAQDCVQEAFLRAWTRRRELSQVRNPQAWVRTVAVRLAVSRWRHLRAGERALRRYGVPAPAPGPGPEHAALVAALAGLGRDQRTALVLHYLCDLPVEEVAHQTGVPVGTAKARLARGRTALAHALTATEASHG